MTAIDLLLAFSQSVYLFIAFVKVDHELENLFEHLIEPRKLKYILHEKLYAMTIAENSEHVFELFLSGQY